MISKSKKMVKDTETKAKLSEDVEINLNIDKEKIIKQEKKKLNDIFTKMDCKIKKTVTNLIEEAAFMAASLKELRAIINTKGYTEEYKNGEHQKGIKKSAEIEIYNTLIKHYMAIMKQLLELLPKSEVAVAENIIQRFGEGREDV